MKPTRNSFIRAALASAIVITATQTLHAQISTWVGTTASLANGAWGTATNWSANGVPNSSTAIANLSANWTTANPTFTLGADRTLNGLEFEDSGTGTDQTGSINAGNILTMAGTTPYINTINSLTLNNVLAGTAGLRKAGPVTLTLNGNNTISGDLNVDAGVVVTGTSANALGTMTVNFTSGDTGRVSFAGGLTYTNNVTVGTGVTGTANEGLLGHTGLGGVATLTGTITLSGLTTNGGVISGSNTTGQELRLNGAINQVGTNIGLTQRNGRVIYAGGGNVTGTFNLTSVALIGATNGLPTGLAPLLGGSGSATLDLNGFDQALPSLLLGNTGATNNFVSTINLGAKTLTLNGNITSQSATTQNVTHLINATTGGTIDVGSTNRTLTLPNTLALDDMLVTNATFNGSGGITKAGAGTLTLKNATVTGPLSISAGGLATGRFTEAAAVTATTGSLAFANATTLRMKSGPAGDQITTGALTTAGTTTVNIIQPGGAIPIGTYPLINYTGTTPGTSGFSLTPFGHATATLVDTGTAIALDVTGNDSIVWDGTASSNWAVGTTGNWKLSSNPLTATDYVESDVVIFNDSPTNNSVTIAANVAPSTVTFNNTTATAYTVSGTTGGIIGITGLTKTADGLLTIKAPNAYTGATTINAGSLVANFANGTAIPSASAISVASGASLTLAHDGGTFALNNPTLTGAGTVTINPSLTTAGNRDIGGVTWNASAFTGPLNLAPTTGTMRIQVDNTADIGTGPVNITAGGQIYISGANLTFPNDFTIAGTGYYETNVLVLGAIRASSTTTFTGTINVKESAKIGALGGTAVIANLLRKDPAAATGDLTFGGSGNQTGGETLAITGDASGLTSITVNDGSATSSAANIVVNIGNGGTTGTIGTVPVTLKADGFKSAYLRYDRADGHTLINSIISAPTAPANEVRNYIDLDCTGAGFNDNSATITLGSAAPAGGGTIRIGQSRANALATLTGTLTGERLWLASGQNNATLNLGATANPKFNAFNLSESANNSATVNHPAGANVEVVGQLRVAHYGTNTSTYNLSGGTLTLTGASPNNSPSTAGAGGNGTNGDNNLNTLNPQQILGGGIYLGNDGTGILNHTDGTITTNWMVLDNRGASGAGTNMPDGIDRYNLSGASSLLKLRSTWGLIGRNDGSYDVSLGGGTIQVDNSGTGTGTGADITVPIDAILSTVAATTTTLDTNGAGNGFTLTKNVNGTGTLALTGGGTVNLSTTTFQNIAANLTSSGTTANLVKLGSGTTTLAGSMAGFTDSVTVSAGRLNVPATLNTDVTVESGATLAGEIALPTLTLNSGTVIFDPITTATLSAGTLNLSGTNLLDIAAAPGTGNFTALTYTTKTGTGTFDIVNGSTYRTAPVVTDDGISTVSVAFTAGKALTWTGTANSTWKIAGDLLTESNWNDNVPAADLFYSGDSVTFPDGPTATAIALTGPLAPAGVNVTSETANYTFTSTSGNQLTGSTGITKSGASTLTLVGPNAYNGVTSINGGTISIAADSLGSGQAGNSIAFSNGGKLLHTGSGTVELGVNRNIAVGTGGGVLEHNNAAAATINIPGALSGSGALAFQSTAAGGATVSLTGNNAAYTGAITVDSTSTGLTTVRIGTPAAAPTASSITLNYPASGATGNATSLTLGPDASLPAATTLNLTSKAASPAPPAVVSLRTQVTTAGGNTAINGPIKLNGDSIIQLSPASGTLTVNGGIGEATPGSFAESPLQAYSNVLFLRGGSATATLVINGQINLPSAGSTVSVTDGVTAIINSTDNILKSAAAVFGTLRLGSATAIPSTARLVIGQAGNQNCTLDLNGFDQTVSGLEWQATTAATTKGVTNTHPTATSTFTINQLAAPAGNFSGTFTGAINLVKKGSATTTLSTALSTFTGNVTVEEGQLTCAAGHNDTNANSALGVTNVGTRSLTVKSGATLAFTGNDNLGNAASAPILPIIVEAGGTLTTAGFNTMGPITLNGGTMAATAGANTTFQAYRLIGTVTAGGTAASAMTASGTNTGYHLHSTTTFTVADATSDAAADLTVSAPLINQSGTQASAAGNLVKDGAGTMTLSGANTYSGNTTINAGTLQLASTGRLSFVIGATTGTSNSLAGAGNIDINGGYAINTTAAAALTAGTWTLENVPAHTGAYGNDFKVYEPDGTTQWTDAGGDKWTKAGAVSGTVWTFDEVTGVLTLAQSGYLSWAGTHAPTGTALSDYDGDGVSNGVEYVLGGTKNTNDLDKLPKPTTPNGDFVFTFNRAKASKTADTTVQIEVGTTLGSWPTTYTMTSPEVTVNSIDADWEEVKLTITRGADMAKFARLKVSIQ